MPSSITANPLTVTVGGQSITYFDVPTDSWFAPFVSSLLFSGIVEGYKNPDGTLTGEFGPGNPVTFAEILKMALLSAGRPLSSGAPQNPSAQQDWSAPYVKTAEDLRLSLYLSSLDVRLPATRGQVIQTILEAFGTPIVPGQSPFSDLPSSSPYAAAIQTAYALGILSGDTDAAGNPVGTVRPTDPINRAEAVKLLSLAIATIVPSPLSSVLHESAPPSPALGTYRVNAYSIKLLAAPQIPSLLYSTLVEGDVITVIALQNGWAEFVVEDGRHVFVTDKYLTKVE